MKYTARFAHLKDAPTYKIGDEINTGDLIGVMGSSGLSTANHLHIDCVQGVQRKPFSLKDMEKNNPAPDKNQLNFFIDDDLFGIKPVITTDYNDPDYFATYGKWHAAYDVVPIDRKKTIKHFLIRWNRSYKGVVSLVVNDPKGYGNCLYVSFDTEVKS